MSSPTSDIIRQLIMDLGLNAGPESGDPPWPVFVGLLTDQPDEAIGVYDTAGKIDGRIMLTGEQVEHPGVQVMVRSPAYLLAVNKAQEIAGAFDLTKGSVVELESGDIYTLLNISRTGAILPLGMGEDDRRRYHFSINAITTIRKG